MAERSNAAVLKTVDGQLSGGSNPSLSAIRELYELAQKQVRTFFQMISEFPPLRGLPDKIKTFLFIIIFSCQEVNPLVCKYASIAAVSLARANNQS